MTKLARIPENDLKSCAYSIIFSPRVSNGELEQEDLLPMVSFNREVNLNYLANLAYCRSLR